MLLIVPYLNTSIKVGIGDGVCAVGMCLLKKRERAYGHSIDITMIGIQRDRKRRRVRK